MHSSDVIVHACSGEGVPDLLMLLIQLTQRMMEEKLMYVSEVQVSFSSRHYLI